MGVLPTRMMPMGAGGKRLPYDAEIEYLESTGTQWINTGILVSSSDDAYFSLDCSITNENLVSSSYTGSGVASVGGLHYVVEKINENVRIRSGGGKTNKSITYSLGSRVKIETYYDSEHRRIVAINGLSYVGGAYDSTTAELQLLKMTGSGTINPQKGNLYSATVRIGSSIVRDLIPVRVGTTGYLYDRVSGQLFGNAGTGSFVLGPDVKVERPLAGLVPVARNVRVLPYDAEVEYVEGTGTQYVDTGLDYFPEYEIGAVVPDAVGNNTLGISQFWKLGRHSAAEPVWRASINGVSHPTTVSCGTYADMSYRGAIFKCNSDTLTVLPNQYAEGTMVLFSTGEALPLAYPLRLYYCRLFDQNGVLIRDYTPVRVGAVGYLYDRANPTGGPSGNGLYGSATSTPLIAGPDKTA